MSYDDPREPEDGPAPECPIEALSLALHDSFCLGLDMKEPRDWAAMANELARELRRSGKLAGRHGYILALQRVGRHVARLDGISESDKDFVAKILDRVRAQAPGESD